MDDCAIHVASFLIPILIFIIVVWVFYPAMNGRISASNKRDKPNVYSNEKGVIKESNQIDKDATVDITLVVPAYNEELRLLPMLKETTNFMNAWCSKKSLSYEIIVVDDGSSDNTLEATKRYMKSENSLVKVLQLGCNRGKGGAIKCGVSHSLGRYILMVDADAATDINDLEKLYDKLQTVERRGSLDINCNSEPLGMAVGSRAHMAGESVATRSLLRTILMKGFHLLVMILISKNIEDTQCGFKLFTRETARALFQRLHLERWSFDVELVVLAEYFQMPIIEVPVNWHEVDGSKLIETKWDIATTSLTMARDMLCVRLCYSLGLWKYRCSENQSGKVLMKKEL